MLGLMQDWPLLCHRVLDHAALNHPDRQFVSRSVEGPIHITNYPAIRTRALKVAQRLARDGIRQGDRVATLGWNTWRHLEAWYGILGIGAVYHTVNPRLFPEQIAWIMAHAKDRAVFVDPQFVPLLERVVDALPLLERVVVLGAVPATATGALPGLMAYEDWLGEVTGAIGWAEPDETEAAGLCYTSGTTGDPRGVLYSHRSTLLHAFSIAGCNAMAIGARDTVMPIVPMFHVNAWGLAFAAPMMGAKLVMPGPKLDGASVHGLMEDEGVTITAGVPTVWMGLLDHLRRNKLRLSTLKHLVVGGSACPCSLIEAYERDYGVEVCHAWGMTEMSPVGSVGSFKPEVAHLEGAARYDLKQKQGYAPFGVEMKIVDDAGTSLPCDGETFGRLSVRGFAVAQSYFEDSTPILDQDGFFDTGDVATIDPQGYVGIVDRTKDVIKSGGEWISSITHEKMAAAHPDVAEAAVIGRRPSRA